MECSFLLGRLGIQERFGLEGVAEVNSGLLEAKNWGQSSLVEVSILPCGLGEGTSWRTEYDTASLLIRTLEALSSRIMKIQVEFKKARGKREEQRGSRCLIIGIVCFSTK